MPDEHRVPRLIAPSRDTHDNWSVKDPVILEGVLGYTKNRLFDGSLEYFVGDGVHKYSELPKYGGAEASSSKKANTLVLRDGNGLIDSASIPASTTTKPNNVVKADSNGGLSGWKNSIIEAIISSDGSGGLATDEDGNMVVDFDQMPTDKFEALLKSLKMQIPLEANMAFYVNKNHANASDNTADITVGNTAHKRGEQDYPFKSIQACVNYVTETYALGVYNINIYVVQATYDEDVTLPNFTKTTGVINLQAFDYTSPPTINKIAATGGTWNIYRFNITQVASDPNNGVPNYNYVVRAIGGNTVLRLYGCAVSTEYQGSASATRYVLVLVNAANGAEITLGVLENYHNSFSCVKGNANAAYMFNAANSGAITIPKSNITYSATTYEIPCSGTVTSFAWVYSRSSMGVTGAATNEQVFTGTVTGKEYECSVLSSIAAPTGGFPGSTDGTVDSTTFAVYQEG